MNNFKCNNCKTDTPASKISVCPNCGTFVCSSCSETNNNLCPYCFEPLNKIN